MLKPSEPGFEPDFSDVQAQLVARDQPDLGDMRAHDVAFSYLNGRGFIQFHPLLAQRLDDFKAAIFLGHALYWSRYLAKIEPHRKGWFFMSASQWAQATGLSPREQKSIRISLVARGVLLEALAGRPAVMHYKVNLEKTAKLLGQPELSWTSMTNLFRSCIRFYKPLADICSSVSAGLYLSYLLPRQSFALRNPQADYSAVELFPGEFNYHPENARIALCLGVKAQRIAREKLRAAGFIREGRASRQVVATRVNLAAIASCLQAQGERTIRKTAPKKGPAREVSSDFPLVTPGEGNLTVPAALLTRASSKLPQRQFNLFSPVGLISKWHLDRNHKNRLAAQDDAATLIHTVTAPAVTPVVGLVMSLFAPWQLDRSKSLDVVAIKDTLTNQLSTNSVKTGNDVALLSNAICLFVDANLPFCRNYKQQGIPRLFQTTTTPVDNSTSNELSRSRIQKSKNPVIQEPRTDSASETLTSGLEIQSFGSEVDGSRAKTSEVGVVTSLVIPDKINATMRTGVLAIIAKAPVEMQQSFLDELAGQLAIPNKTIHNPIGWLHSLIRRHREGFVALAMAPTVAEQRVKHQRNLERQAAAVSRKPSDCATKASFLGSDGSAAAKTGTDTEDSEIKRVYRQRLLELRKDFVPQRGGHQ